ncbi:MAG: tetratricopeptide repeat protein [Tepidisphaeraceae bacterium]|jgi:predicted O-linked N-acetylglucosamine transferase (SPINDLY family)
MSQASTEQWFESAVSLHQSGKLQEAEALYRQILAAKPDDGDVAQLLGMLRFGLGDKQEALQLLRRALAMNPQAPDCHCHLALVLMDLGQCEEAMDHLRRAVQLKPDFAEAHLQLGLALRQAGRRQEAAAALQQAIAVKPDYLEAYNNLGVVLRSLGQWDQSVQAYRRALELRGDLAEIHKNLASVLTDSGQIEQAVAEFRQALTLRPDWADAYAEMARALFIQGRWDQATAACQRAVDLQPGHPDAYCHLGNAHKNIGQLDHAIEAYRRALAAKPDYWQVHSNLVLLFHYSADYSAADLLQELREWDQRHAQPLKRFITPHGNDPDPDRRLKIGYVSPDFCLHIAGMTLLPLFRQHDHSAFEVFCYYNLLRQDPWTEKFRACADHWRDIAHESNESVAQMIREDGIDILVDLAVHSANNRLLLFARKPAPVQVTFGGYPGGTGLEAMDYRLTDPYLDPPGMTEDHYVEKLVRLADSFWCYDPQVMEVAQGFEVGPPPALASGHVTFASLNIFCKVSDPMLKLWARVLEAVPRSRLMLLAPPGSSRQHVLEHIDPSRVDFTGRLPREQYLQAYRQIDIGLDTLPYNGHTTSLDALWMGVPVVTLVGQTAVGRATWSQLSNLKLQELAAHRPEDFVRIAAELAGDLPRLREIRSGLRQRMLASPLTDARRFAHNIQIAYRQMWQSWCQTRSRHDSNR